MAAMGFVLAGFLFALLNHAASATVVVFTSTTFWLVPTNITHVNVLVVAGGGGGGSDGGGGGGAGGLIFKQNVTVPPGELVTVIVGAGGKAGSRTGDFACDLPVGCLPIPALPGGPSSFGAISTIGGGPGLNSHASTPGITGGSGGGGGYCKPALPVGSQPVCAATQNPVPPGKGTQSQGFVGGVAYVNNSGGGGGGAGTSGGAATAFGGGAGGVGALIGITGTPTFYAGGGAGGSWAGLPNVGGQGGGGASGGNFYAASSNNATSGAPNTGGGGGGGGFAVKQPPGDGGSGVVIVSYI